MATAKRDTLLTLIVLGVLVAAIPFAVWEFIQTGEFYLLSHRFLPDIVARFHGPGRLRFILQPTIATILGMRDGAKDARAGNPPYLWGLALHTVNRSKLFRSGSLRYGTWLPWRFCSMSSHSS